MENGKTSSQFSEELLGVYFVIYFTNVARDENEKIIKANRELEKRVATLERETKDYERLKRVIDKFTIY